MGGRQHELPNDAGQEEKPELKLVSRVRSLSSVPWESGLMKWSCKGVGVEVAGGGESLQREYFRSLEAESMLKGIHGRGPNPSMQKFDNPWS